MGVMLGKIRKPMGLRAKEVATGSVFSVLSRDLRKLAEAPKVMANTSPLIT